MLLATGCAFNKSLEGSLESQSWFEASFFVETAPLSSPCSSLNPFSFLTPSPSPPFVFPQPCPLLVLRLIFRFLLSLQLLLRRWKERRGDEWRWGERRWEEMRWAEKRWQERRWEERRWCEEKWGEMTWRKMRLDELTYLFSPSRYFLLRPKIKLEKNHDLFDLFYHFYSFYLCGPCSLLGLCGLCMLLGLLWPLLVSGLCGRRLFWPLLPSGPLWSAPVVGVVFCGRCSLPGLYMAFSYDSMKHEILTYIKIGRPRLRQHQWKFIH